MIEMNRQIVAEIIYEKLNADKEILKSKFNNSRKEIGHFYIDDLLPEEMAKSCYEAFPEPKDMRCLKSIREYKYISAQMNAHNPLLEEVLYAFQDKKVVDVIGEICQIESLVPDESLYAGGLSLMAENNFLHPHLDNSHDAARDQWRVLNLLYYVTPNWEKQCGGHLEIWPNGPKKEQIVIESKFNRLTIMATHSKSWHSVSKVRDTSSRCCISNYYFSEQPLRTEDAFHVTKFRGRPENPMTDAILRLDGNIRMIVRKLFKKGIRKNPHIYKK